jgi:hypothetical protein
MREFSQGHLEVSKYSLTLKYKVLLNMTGARTHRTKVLEITRGVGEMFDDTGLMMKEPEYDNQMPRNKLS